jgi:predicted AlkP superfamily pyrophosphatase or phosphodiesterase
MVVVISLDGFPAYSLDDASLPIPTLRELMRTGVSARMSTVNPTVTWPNHTTLVSGVQPAEHGVLVNGTIVRTGAWPPVKVDPKVDQARMVRAPTLYGAAHAAGLTTAQVDWVAINNAPAIAWPFMEWASPEGAVESEMIRKGALAAADVRDFTKLNILRRDQVWTQAAAYLIREHRPNLVLLHLLSLDSVHHTYGPKTLAATGAIAFLDGCVAQVLAAVRAAGMQDRTTMFIVADHGFKSYTKEIRPAVALRAAGLEDQVYVMPEGGSAIVYVESGHRGEVLPRAMKALEGVEGIDRIIGPDGYAALGLPAPDRDPQMGELLLTAKAGYSFSGATGGPVTAAVPQTGGSHGYLASDSDMDALFIASGYGIQGGVMLGRIANLDVAPTIANLLGVGLPSAKGKTLPILR